MAEFKHLNSIGRYEKITIASGPVIIQDGKVLLDKHDDDFWKFPGGKVADNESFQQTAIREVKEELGINVELSGEPLVMTTEIEREGIKELLVLIHYKASFEGEVKPGENIDEWAWHDVNDLPQDLAPNIEVVVEHFLKLG